MYGSLIIFSDDKFKNNIYIGIIRDWDGKKRDEEV
jgi:hypothetical protein